MTNKKISIIISHCTDISGINSLMQQSLSDFECIITENKITNIEKYISNDSRFKILPSKFDAINKSHGDYIIILNDNDILIQNALKNISDIANLTNADVIHFSLNKPLIDSNKGKFLNYALNNLSEFCFKREIISNLSLLKSEHVFLMNALMNAKNMINTNNSFIIINKHNSIPAGEYIDIVKNYVYMKKDLSPKYWKKYFQKIIPDIVKSTTKSNDKDTFVFCCKHINKHFIPWRYKFIFFLMKITNKS